MSDASETIESPVAIDAEALRAADGALAEAVERRQAGGSAPSARRDQQPEAVDSDQDPALASVEIDSGAGVLLAALPLVEAALAATQAAAFAELSLAPEAGLAAGVGDSSGGGPTAAEDGGSSAAAEPHVDDGYGNDFGANPRGPYEGLPRPPFEVPEYSGLLLEEEQEPAPEEAPPPEPTPPSQTPYPEEPLDPIDLLCTDDEIDLTLLDLPDTTVGPDQLQQDPDGPEPTDGGPREQVPADGCPDIVEPQLDHGPAIADELSILV